METILKINVINKNNYDTKKKKETILFNVINSQID